MTVTVYYSTDASAPSLTGSAGSLIAVLDACLVNGYGAKPAAGWTKAFAGTNLASYRTGTGNQYYLAVDDTGVAFGTNFVRLQGFTSMSAVTTGQGQWPLQFQLTAQSGAIVMQKSTTTDSTVRAWVLVASGSGVYFLPEIAATVGAWVGTTNVGSGNGQFFFGDIVSYKPNDLYSTALIGCVSTTASNGVMGVKTSGVNGALTASTGHYLARGYSQLTPAVGFTKAAPGDYTAGITFSANSSGTIFPDPVTGGMTMAPVEVLEANSSLTGAAAGMVIRGRLPGLWAPLSYLPGLQGDVFSGVGDLAGRTFMLFNAYQLAVTGRLIIEISNTW